MDQQIRFAKTSDGASLAYARVGSGPPVVRVLGWFTNLSLEWERQETRSFWEQIATGHELLRYDGRGMGISDAWQGDFNAETRLRDLEAVIDSSGLEQFTLFGQSEGGATAVCYAAAHPERVISLVLFGSMARFGRGAESSQQALDEQQAMLTLVRNGWGSDSPRFRQLFTSLFIPSATPEQVEWFNEFERESARPETAAAYLEAVYNTDVRAEAANVAAPTLVLHRRDDEVVRFAWGRSLAATIPDAQFVPVDGDNHMLGADPVADAPVVRATLDFLEATHSSPSQPAAPSQQHPSGSFRTILFTDVVASTPLLVQLKDAKMREVMRAHDELLDAAVTNHGGRVVKTIGDAFMAEFPVPSAALEAALEAQRAITERFEHSDFPVRIRIGINAGEPIEEDGDLHGASVVLAKRLESAADVGGILVSDVVRQAVAGKDFAFEDRGALELKGFDEPVRAWAVDAH